MRIALCQINPTVGDIAANSAKIIDFATRARAAGATIAVFPELSIIGYPPKDLLLKPSFIDENLAALPRIAKATDGIDVIVGFAARNTAPVGRPLHNAAAVLRGGAIASRHFKTLLPTYDVFDESRYFEPGPRHGNAAARNDLVSVGDAPVGLSICEDLWNDERLISHRLYHQNPIAELSHAGASLLVNISASPYVEGKHDFRRELFASQVLQVRRPLVYVNQVGGNDELIFDGNSLVIDAQGNIIAQAKEFEEDLLLVDMPTSPGKPAASARIERHTRGVESIHRALVLGLRDYVEKCRFKAVVLGLSGGIDSAVTAALAVHALGPKRVSGIAMPSRFSSDHSISDARLVAQNLGIEFHITSIETVHEAYAKTLGGIFNGPPCDLTDENLQARIRGATLMAFSNNFGHLLLTTGNKSELAVGYCTLYGDMCGGLAVISDVPKTAVYGLAKFINQQAGRDLIPSGSITKAPSAELRPNQTDQDSLPPYDVLDAILHLYIEEEQSVAQITAAGFDPQTVQRVTRLVDRSEYKRRQAAPGLKVTSRAFGFGRRMPIAQNYVPPMP
jgi:NAD+ synthetase